nr:hypothetical protein Iba_chr12fCG16210 [Ipomoea batatas]
MPSTTTNRRSIKSITSNVGEEISHSALPDRLPIPFLFLSLIFSARRIPLICSITFSGAESTTISLGVGDGAWTRRRTVPRGPSPEEKEIRSKRRLTGTRLYCSGSSSLFDFQEFVVEFPAFLWILYGTTGSSPFFERISPARRRPAFAERVEQTVLAELDPVEGAEAEIRDFQVAVLVEEEILRLLRSRHLSKKLPALQRTPSRKISWSSVASAPRGGSWCEGLWRRRMNRDLPFYVPDHGGARDLLLVDHLIATLCPLLMFPRVVNLWPKAPQPRSFPTSYFSNKAFSSDACQTAGARPRVRSPAPSPKGCLRPNRGGEEFKMKSIKQKDRE